MLQVLLLLLQVLLLLLLSNPLSVLGVIREGRVGMATSFLVQVEISRRII